MSAVWSHSSFSGERVACHCENKQWRASGQSIGQERAGGTVAVAVAVSAAATYTVQQVKFDTDRIPFSAVDGRLASMSDLLEGVETPGAAVSKRAEDAAQVVTEDDVHEKGTVDEAGAVENVVVLVFDLVL